MIDLNTNSTNFISKCLVLAVSTRNQNPDEQEFSNGVIDNYRLLENMSAVLDEKGIKATEREIKEALAILNQIFRAKKIDKNEHILRFDKLLAETGQKEVFQDYVSQLIKGD